MNAPELCYHREAQDRVDQRGQDFIRRSATINYLVDWSPSLYTPDDMPGILAVECQVVVPWLDDCRQSDGTYAAYGYEAFHVVYHTPMRQYRPHRYRGGRERLSNECHWQEGAEFRPDYFPARLDRAGHWTAQPCWEGRLLRGFSHRIFQAYVSDGESAIFASLEHIWMQVFRAQYHLCLPA